MTTSADAARRTPLQIQREIPGNNRARLLQLLYRDGDRSRADLARAAGLTKPTVSSLVAEMLDAGILVETRQRRSERPGRPAVDLDLARTHWNVIALDLSPFDEFRGAVLDLTGAILARASVPRDGDTGEAALAKVKTLIDGLIGRYDGRVLGIGICAPGVVDPQGVVLSSLNLGWSKLPLRAIITDHTGLPTCIDNDANAAALAERDLNHAYNDLLLVKLAHGVGAAILANGKLIHGPQFAAGEIGHISVGEGDGPQCICGRYGCLEATLALPRLLAQLADAGTSQRRREVLERAGAQLGTVLAPLIGGLGLGSVVISAPPDLPLDPLLAATRDELAVRLPADTVDSLDVRLTSLGEDIALQGALILVLSGVLGIS